MSVDEFDEALEIGLGQTLRQVGIHLCVDTSALPESILLGIGKLLYQRGVCLVGLHESLHLGIALKGTGITVLQDAQSGPVGSVGFGCLLGEEEPVGLNSTGEVLHTFVGVGNSLMQVGMERFVALGLCECLAELGDGLLKLSVAVECLTIVLVVHVRDGDAVLINLVEEGIGILQSLGIHIQFVAAKHGDTVQRTVQGLLSQTGRHDVEGLLVLASVVVGHGILDIVHTSQFFHGHLRESLVGLTIAQGNIVDVADEGINGIVGAHGTQFLQFLYGSLRVYLTIDEGILAIRLGVLRVEVDGLLVVDGSVARVVFLHADVAHQQVGRSELVFLHCQCLFCKNSCIGRVVGLVECEANSTEKVRILLVLLEESLDLLVVVGRLVSH